MGRRRAHSSATYKVHPNVQLIGALEIVDGLAGAARTRAMRSLGAWIRDIYEEEDAPEPHVVKLLETIDESETPDSIRQKINYLVPPPGRIDL